MIGRNRMIVNGMKGCSVYGDWGVRWVQIEFLEGGMKRFISVSEYDQERSIVLSDEDLIDLILDEKFEPDEHGAIVGELVDILPQIVKSPYCADICFAMESLKHFPELQEKEEWETKAGAYIGKYIGKASEDLI